MEMHLPGRKLEGDPIPRWDALQLVSKHEKGKQYFQIRKKKEGENKYDNVTHFTANHVVTEKMCWLLVELMRYGLTVEELLDIKKAIRKDVRSKSD